MLLTCGFYFLETMAPLHCRELCAPQPRLTLYQYYPLSVSVSALHVDTVNHCSIDGIPRHDQSSAARAAFLPDAIRCIAVLSSCILLLPATLFFFLHLIAELAVCFSLLLLAGTSRPFSVNEFSYLEP